MTTRKFTCESCGAPCSVETLDGGETIATHARPECEDFSNPVVRRTKFRCPSCDQVCAVHMRKSGTLLYEHPGECAEGAAPPPFEKVNDVLDLGFIP